jgi:hypothetical protein
LEANVSERLGVGSAGFCAGLAAREDAGAKGFACAFVEGGEENGFTDVEGDGEEMPKSAAPMSMDGCGSAVSSSFEFELVVSGLFVTLLPLIPLILPSFRRQALRLHVKRYSRRSWSGNRDGRSPFSCSSRLMNELQTLHFPSAPEGAVLSSSHVWRDILARE